MIRYKNDMNKLDITRLSSTELKLFMGICADLKDEESNYVTFDILELKEYANLSNKSEREIVKMLENICDTLMNVKYWEFKKEKGKNKMGYSFIVKAFFESFEYDEASQTLTVSVNPNLTYLLNDWKLGRWSQFALEVFNSIKGFAAKQLFRFLVEYSNYKKMYISLELLQQMLKGQNARPNDFIDKTIVGAMKQMENLGIILPGWSVERKKRKYSADTVKLTYELTEKVKVAKPEILKKDHFKLDPIIEGQVKMLKQQGKSDDFIECFIETEDYIKAEILYNHRKSLQDKDIGFDDLNEKEQFANEYDENVPYILNEGTVIIKEEELPFY